MLLMRNKRMDGWMDGWTARAAPLRGTWLPGWSRSAESRLYVKHVRALCSAI